MKLAYKVCGDCCISLPASSFYKDKRGSGGLYYRCKKCQRIYFNKYRKKNAKKIARQMKKSRRQLKREKMLMILKYLAQHPCVDCGETDPCCLDFDHVRGRKLHAISYMVTNVNSDEKIFKEISKCEVRCANCHRRKTAQEREYYSYIDFNTMTIKA